MSWQEIGQGVLAVGAGFATMTALVMLGTAGMMVLLGANGSAAPAAGTRPSSAMIGADLLVGLIAALAGGAVTAWLAASAPLLHALTLAAVVIVMSVYCAVAYAGQQPRWHMVVLGAGAPLAVLAGAWLQA